MQETETKNKNTIVIQPFIKAEKLTDSRSPETKLEEAIGLADAIDLDICLTPIIALQNIVPGTYFGSGKITELAGYVQSKCATLVVVNDKLTPVQQRNLENDLKCKVIDRTALILEIFGARAQTKEGSLQVELAAHEYQKSRLVRSWTHLERQRGGGGFMGGPGEKQIESDRRVIREKISKIKKQIQKVAQTREMHRKARQKTPYDVVALVGYTNAGKSTLFNRLTGASVMAEDKLFATLDPTMRVIKLPSGRGVILSDTVGFISDLPTELVAAFRATLEEVVFSNMMLHVRDISSSETIEQKQDVLDVLKVLGMEAESEEKMIEVLNKVDLLDDKGALQESYEGRKDIAGISAVTGDGVENLLNLIDEHLAANDSIEEISVPCYNGKAIAWLHSHCDIIEQNQEESQINFKISISEKDLGKLSKLL